MVFSRLLLPLTVVEKQMAVIDHEQHVAQKVHARPSTRVSARSRSGFCTDEEIAGRLGCIATSFCQFHIPLPAVAPGEIMSGVSCGRAVSQSK